MFFYWPAGILGKVFMRCFSKTSYALEIKKMNEQIGFFAHGGWLGFVRRYMVLSGLANLVWEFVQMPLYTLWQDDSWLKIILFALHCTAGDVAIASAALLSALLLLGTPDWPRQGYRRIAYLTIFLGFCYTVYSEWLNVYVRKSWGYAPAMPLLPPFNIGLTPLLQWIFIPAAILLYCRACQQKLKAACAQTEEM